MIYPNYKGLTYPLGKSHSPQSRSPSWRWPKSETHRPTNNHRGTNTTILKFIHVSQSRSRRSAYGLDKRSHRIYREHSKRCEITEMARRHFERSTFMTFNETFEHHQQPNEIARLAERKSHNEQLRQITKAIIDDQTTRNTKITRTEMAARLSSQIGLPAYAFGRAVGAFTQTAVNRTGAFFIGRKIKFRMR
jgi:hypothetical protein